MRIRKDVKEGMLVVENYRGWMVPLTIASEVIGEVVSIYKDGKIIPYGILHSRKINLSDGKSLYKILLMPRNR